jgi:protoporphyrinogen oxidase
MTMTGTPRIPDAAERVVIIGAGPAGLTAAYQLQKLDPKYVPIVIEADTLVGGIARTESHNGYRFDIGGHRFFTKVPEVEAMWHEVMGEDFIKVPRLSRIYYQGRYFRYPLKLFNALYNLGLYESFRIVLSYGKWRLRPNPREESFEDWVINRFGGRLYIHFFRSYTSKVWGIPPNQIQADWAAQRIKNLSLGKAIWNAISGVNKTTSLIEEFHYPRLGPGMLWERVRDMVTAAGGEIRIGREVCRVLRDGSRITAAETRVMDAERNERIETIEADHFISSMALRDLIERFDPPPPEAVRTAAAKLRYRDFLIVTLILEGSDLFPDNWIYVHSPQVSVGRIQNFRAWSAAMVPDPTKSSIGMEYFCSEGDALWELSDEALIAKAAAELEHLGLAPASAVVDGAIIRQPKAYPVYDGNYKAAVAVLADWINSLENFQTVGRNGLHRYNNQDHSMLTAMLAARNIMGESHDVWSVNVERSYHEEFQMQRPEVMPKAVGAV